MDPGPRPSEDMQESSARRRRPEDEDGLYREIEKLRYLVQETEEEQRDQSCGRLFNVSENLMSTVFGVVLFVILGVTVYAFTSLYKAIMKRFYNFGYD